MTVVNNRGEQIPFARPASKDRRQPVLLRERQRHLVGLDLEVDLISGVELTDDVSNLEAGGFDERATVGFGLAAPYFNGELLPSFPRFQTEEREQVVQLRAFLVAIGLSEIVP
jgi:hypothetical protein